ncbi:NAD(P)-dependent oxidoreductase [Phytomonospora endophytica]|uniref:3-hydroxyisobutyrate dehydrogenase-like beta-hydroxyacid dehydrogenase n=1 Tax=Phytomonospora endophytica TaxID=714109 RepID=A0A841FPY6_9ACTN|nr:NAD(P)-binding domain-containing protein [Phytomonospora endophytica]MBB6038156.1 3-hydroxyisobutyrate dehydrogenase-like beta-hydroxyacid dehydrogenase [Phytomonospora endophytica]
MPKTPVTVIGLGPMGRAMTRAFLAAGHPVTVWNRTPARAAALVGEGAVLAGTPTEAIAASPLLVLSLTDLDAVHAVVDGAALRGKTVVNLSSDTPDRARETARWAESHGAGYLSGAMMASPDLVASDAASVFVSGPKDLFDEHAGTIALIAKPDYRGEDPGLGPLYYQLVINIFWTTMLAHVQTIAIARANGISATEFLPYALSATESNPHFFPQMAAQADAGEFPGDLERLSMGMESVRHVLRTAEEAGVDTTLPAAMVAVFRRGLDAGLGEKGFTGLVDVLGER